MATNAAMNGPQQQPQRAPATLKAIAPQVDEAANYGKQKILAVLASVDARDAAKALLGCDIVAATESGIARARITKTRAFQGIGKHTENRPGIMQDAGMVYIMKHRVAKFLNITTGREGNPSCVWVEEAMDLKTGMMVKNNALLRLLQLETSDRMPIFTESTGIVEGVAPAEIKSIDLGEAQASKNTTGVYAAVLPKEASDGAAVAPYTKTE